jgi:hypothetical protein
MKYLVYIVAALLPGLSLAAEPWTLSTQGYGPIRHGMTRADAERLMDTPLRTQDNSPLDAGCDYLYPVKGHKGISFMVLNGRITRVNVTTKDVATRTGARVGDSVAKLHSLFGSSLEIETHKYDASGKYFYIWESSRKRGEKFEVIGGRVKSIYAGDDSIDLVEGCY